ncbi:hypothetical protein VAA_00910 [Vibrio anguillarum 775]|nr:hypothetical protein VAA_00910 [Vibrio anguillarum 775]
MYGHSNGQIVYQPQKANQVWGKSRLILVVRKFLAIVMN